MPAHYLKAGGPVSGIYW